MKRKILKFINFIFNFYINIVKLKIVDFESYRENLWPSINTNESVLNSILEVDFYSKFACFFI